jgi:predicted O-methyltransferase YrrM
MHKIKEWVLDSSSLLLTILSSLSLILFNYYILKASIGATESIIIGILFAITISGFLLLLKVILNKSRWLESRIQNAKAEVQATLSISKFFNIPHTFEEYQASAQFIRHLVREIYLKKPNLILELGSGSSTSIIASCLMEIGRGKIISVEHDKYYAKKTNEILKIEGNKEYAQIVLAPLKIYDLEKGHWKWYDLDLDKFQKLSIDILVIDGPPDKIQYQSRYPAMPLINEYLAKNCLIFLDDTLRKDERKIFNKWIEKYNIKLVYENKRCGYVVLMK